MAKGRHQQSALKLISQIQEKRMLIASFALTPLGHRSHLTLDFRVLWPRELGMMKTSRAKSPLQGLVRQRIPRNAPL
jgi:hypothetical protein